MRIKLDENLPRSAVTPLIDAGHDVDTTHTERLDGAEDPDVLAAATADDRLVLTLDRGFGDIRAHPPGTHVGILVVRLDNQSADEVERTLERIVASLDLEDLAGSVAVWRDGSLRVRRP